MNNIQKLFFIFLGIFSLTQAHSPIDELMRKQYFIALAQQNINTAGDNQPTYKKHADGRVTISCTWDMADSNLPAQLEALTNQAEEKIKEEKTKQRAKSIWRNMLREAIEGIQLNLGADTLFTKCTVRWEPSEKKTISCIYTAVLSEILNPTK